MLHTKFRENRPAFGSGELKIASNLWLLSKLKEYLSTEHRVQFYKTYIQPHIDYCSTVCGGTSHSNLNRI